MPRASSSASIVNPALHRIADPHLLDGQTEGLRTKLRRGLSLLRSSEVSGELALLVVGLVAGDEPGCVERAPADIQAVLSRNAAKAALNERRDIRTQEPALEDLLKRQGMQFNATDDDSMRARLAPFYARWKNEFGPTVWSLLEATSGKLG